MNVAWWFVLVAVIWAIVVIAVLRLLNRTNRRDEEAIIDSEFDRIVESARHDIVWDDETGE